MKFIAEVNVMPLKALLDPQGKAVTSGLHHIGMEMVENVRIGKHISFEVEASSKEQAEGIVEKACKELLHNPIMESYQFELSELK